MYSSRQRPAEAGAAPVPEGGCGLPGPLGSPHFVTGLSVDMRDTCLFLSLDPNFMSVFFGHFKPFVQQDSIVLHIILYIITYI